MEYLFGGLFVLSSSTALYLYKKNLILKNEKTLTETTKNVEIQFLNEKNSLLQKSIEEIKSSEEHLINKFKAISEEILENQSSKNINSIINPFKEDLREFKSHVSNIYTEEAKDRSMLKQELLHLKELNKNITEETSNLTKALKGENKTLGNWGEMVLEKVLENSGLRKDQEYSREVSLRDGNNEAFRPDVVVHLPENRDVIIDAKASLVSYERYISSADDKYLKEHIDSIKNHIKRLSDKEYAKLNGINSLDFIFMFVPIESSLTIAMEKEPQLFDFAYKNNIFLVTPSSLLIALRSIENSWKSKKQEENVKKIVDKAGAVYDKFVGFVQDIEKVHTQLNTATKTFDQAKNKLFEGKGNLVKQLEDLKDMGANSSKKLN